MSRVIDNLFSALERPVGTPSGHNTVWHDCAPYDPQMLETYLTIFRTVNNFVFVGDDSATPAEPLRYEGILWPGQAAPQPKRERRTGAKHSCLARISHQGSS